MIPAEQNRLHSTRKFIGTWMVVFLLSFPVHAIADDSTRTAETGGFWVNAGAGFGITGFMVGVGITIDNDPLILSGRFTHAFEFLLFQGTAPLDKKTPSKDIDEVSFLVGIIASRGTNHASFSIGPAFIRERSRGKHLYSTHPSFLSTVHHFESVMISSLGLSLEAQHYLRPLRGFGIGITITAVASKRVVSVGGVLCIQLGNWTYVH